MYCRHTMSVSDFSWNSNKNDEYVHVVSVNITFLFVVGSYVHKVNVMC